MTFLHVANDFAMPSARYVNPSTGIMQLVYPMTWLGIGEYELREIMYGPGVVLPARFEGKSPRTVIRVLHTSEDACTPAFAQSSYGAPCIQGDHPLVYHAKLAPSPICGMLGTSHECLESVNGLGPVPHVIASVYSPITMRLIDEEGADESSLAYSFKLRWAEEGETYRGMAFDLQHIMACGQVNHMVIGLPPGDSRGGTRARRKYALDVAGVRGVAPAIARDSLARKISRFAAATHVVFSGQRPTPRYSRSMKITLTPPIASALGRASDTAIELPDETVAALRGSTLLADLQALVNALSLALQENGELTEQVGTMAATAAETDTKVAALAADAAKGREVLLQTALTEAAMLGVPIACDRATGLPPRVKGVDEAGKPFERDATATDVHATVVRARLGAAYDAQPPSQREGFVRGAYAHILSAVKHQGPQAPQGQAGQGGTVQRAADTKVTPTPGAGVGPVTLPVDNAARDNAGTQDSAPHNVRHFTKLFTGRAAGG